MTTSNFTAPDYDKYSSSKGRMFGQRALPYEPKSNIFDGFFDNDPSDQFRAAFLPYRITSDGKRKFAAPGMLSSLLLDELPYAAETIHLGVTGQLNPGDPETIDRVTRLGMLQGGGGYLGGRLFNPGGATLGVFAGSSAKEANQNLMKEPLTDSPFDQVVQNISENPLANRPDRKDLVKAAEQDPDAVFKETGLFTLGDGRLRFEIDDRNMKNALSDNYLKDLFQPDYGVEVIDQSGAVIKSSPIFTMDEVIDHPELFKNYPQLKKIDVQFVNDATQGSSFNPQTNLIKINMKSLPSHGLIDDDAKTVQKSFKEFKDEILDVAIHELQHAVDVGENMPSTGGNLSKNINSPLLNKVDSPAYQAVQDKVGAFNAFNQNFQELENLSIAKLIKQYKDKSKKPNIKPAELRRQGQFYTYSDTIRSELGAPPKNPGAERDAYYQMAFNILADRLAKDFPGARSLINMETKNIDANIKRLQKALNADRADYEAYLDADKYYKTVKENFGVSGYGGDYMKDFPVYQNILGEAVARAVQARRGETRIPGFFSFDKKLFKRPDNPVDQFTKFYEPGSRMERIISGNPLNRVGKEYMTEPPILGLTGAFK